MNVSVWVINDFVPLGKVTKYVNGLPLTWNGFFKGECGRQDLRQQGKQKPHDIPHNSHVAA